jgi:hypothetical protein
MSKIGYFDFKKQVFVYYEISWFCNDGKLIHKREKDFNECISCNKKNNERDKQSTGFYGGFI